MKPYHPENLYYIFQSERSEDMFCDDIFGESPAGIRKSVRFLSLMLIIEVEFHTIFIHKVVGGDATWYANLSEHVFICMPK
jgi:hypothetical protein